MGSLIEEKEEQIKKLRGEVYALHAAEAKAKNEELVGKCFVYRGCYSCPRGPEDYWNVYSLVTHLADDGDPMGVYFEVTRDGDFHAKADRVKHLLTSEISREKWDEEARKHLASAVELLGL